MTNNINKKYVAVDYTKRDFNSLRAELVNYAKRYYPDTFRDFTDSSFASLLIDTVAYTGDMLSFYLDYQFNESLISTANEYENVLKIAKQLGYREKGTQSAYGRVALYVIVPSSGITVGPDYDYAPVLLPETVLAGTNGESYMLTDPVDFSDSSAEVVVARVNETTGLPTSYAIKTYGNVVSGLYRTLNFEIGSFEKFRKIIINDLNLTEIISVEDTQGNKYYEVDYLSQDVIYTSEINTDPSTKQQTPSLLIPIPAPRRFVLERTRNSVELVFGQSSKSNLASNLALEPSNIAFQRYGRNYSTDSIFDPLNLISNEQFGIGPENTTITIKYRRNTNNSVNSPVGTVSIVSSPIVDFVDISKVNPAVASSVISSLECYNEDPITTIPYRPNVEDIKQMAMSSFAAQSRAVTSQDYESVCYRMPAKHGSILRVRAVKDNDSLKRNINLYVLSGNNFSKFIMSNSKTKQNLKSWINNYKMLNDSIDILDGKIVNFGIDFEINVQDSFNKYDVLSSCVTKLKQQYGTKIFYIGEKINILEIYTLLNKIKGVSDVLDVVIQPKTGTGYSSDALTINRYKTPDGRSIIPPENVAFEIKFPDNDIRGIAR